MSTGYTSLTTYQASVMSLKFEELEERGKSDDFEKKLMLLTDVSIDGLADSTELYTFTIRMFASLQSLNLIGVPSSTIRDLSIFRAQLKELEVSNTGIFKISDLLLTNEELQVLQSLPLLINESGGNNNNNNEEDLNIMNHDIKNVMLKKGDEFILSRGWRAMRTLKLINCDISIMDESFLMLPSLEHLDLSDNDLFDVVNLERCYKLSTLNLSYNRIDSLLDFGFTLGSIRELNLSHNKIQSLEGLDRLLALEKLDLRHNNIGSIEAVDYLVALPRFKALHLKGCPVSNSSNYRINVLSRFVQDPSILHTSARVTDSNTQENDYLNKIAQVVPILDGSRASTRESKELKSMIFIPVEGQIQSRFSRPSSRLPRSPHRNRTDSGNSTDMSRNQMETLKELVGVDWELNLNTENRTQSHEEFLLYLNPDSSSPNNSNSNSNNNDNNSNSNSNSSSMNTGESNIVGTPAAAATTTTTCSSDGNTLALVTDASFLSPAQTKSQYTPTTNDSKRLITPQSTSSNVSYIDNNDTAIGKSSGGRNVSFSFVSRTPKVMPRPVARKALVYLTAQHMQQATSTPSPRDVKNLLQQLEIETREKKSALSSKVSDLGRSTDEIGFEDSDGSLCLNDDLDEQVLIEDDEAGYNMDNIIDDVYGDSTDNNGTTPHHHHHRVSTPHSVGGEGGLLAIEAAVNRASHVGYSPSLTDYDDTPINHRVSHLTLNTTESYSHTNRNSADSGADGDILSNRRTWSNDTRILLESLGVPDAPFTSDRYSYSTQGQIAHHSRGSMNTFSMSNKSKPSTQTASSATTGIGSNANEVNADEDRMRSSLRLSSGRERDTIGRESFTDTNGIITSTSTGASERHSFQGPSTPTSTGRRSIDRYSLDNRSVYSDGYGTGGGGTVLDNTVSTCASPNGTPLSANDTPKRNRGGSSRENFTMRMSDDASECGNSVSDDASWRSSTATTPNMRNSLSRQGGVNPAIRESLSLIENEAEVSINTVNSEDETLQSQQQLVQQEQQRVNFRKSANFSIEDCTRTSESQTQSLAVDGDKISSKTISTGNDSTSTTSASTASSKEKKPYFSMFQSTSSTSNKDQKMNNNSDITDETGNKHQKDILPEDQQVYLGRRDKESLLVGSHFQEYLQEQVFLGKSLTSLNRSATSLSASAMSYNGQHAARERDRIGRPYLVDERGVQLGSSSSRWVTSGGVGNRDALGMVRMSSHSVFSTSSVPNETVMNVFKMCSLIKTHEVSPSSQKNLRQSIGDDEYEAVDFSDGDSSDVECTLVYVLTDVHLYVMRTELWSLGSIVPANMLVFSQAPVPIVLHKHPLEALNRLTLFFGMQRLILDFIEITVQTSSNDDATGNTNDGGNSNASIIDITSDGSGRLGTDADSFMRLDPANRSNNSNNNADSARLTSLVDRMISSNTNFSSIQERSYVVLGREKVECHRFVVAVMKAANLRKTRASPPLKSTFVSNKDSELLDALPALFPNYIKSVSQPVGSGPRTTVVVANPDLYQMCYRCYRKKPGFLESRTIIVSGRYVLLCDEALLNHKVHLRLVDITRAEDIHKIVSEESPLRVTLVLNPQGGSSFAQFARRKWRLEAPSNSACVRMLDHFRSLAPHAMEIDT